MKFAKTFCKANSALSIVPAGLQVILQYNEHGILQDFRIGFTSKLDPMHVEDGLKVDHDAIFARIKKFVPNMISAKGGTTWVFGVMYSDNVPMDEGRVPIALYQSYINDIVKGGQYTFYAGYAKSLAMQLSGSLIIRNFLTSAKFNLLPQVIVPATMKKETLDMAMDAGSYSFNKPFIAGYFIFEDLNCRYVSDVLFQIKVCNSPELYVDKDGCWKADVMSESGEKYVFTYSSLLHNNIKKGAVILAEREDNTKPLTVSATRLKGGAQIVPKSTPESVKCPVCGKVNMVGTDNTPYFCDDPHCLSHQYADACKMLSMLKLPPVSYEQYKELINKKEIQCLTDILALPDYSGVEIKATMAQAINAVTPTEVVPNSELFEKFANKCNNQVDTVCYYLDNPLRMETDLDLVDPIVKRFATWLQDPYNSSTVRTILDIVAVEGKSRLFDGDPIFRGMSFVLTGRFKRGDYYTISSILESYAATVVPDFEKGKKLPAAVIQGSLNDGISGKIIQKAHLHKVPVFDEDLFFEQYEIDSDMEKNLL